MYGCAAGPGRSVTRSTDVAAQRQGAPSAGNALRIGADHGLAWPLVPDFQLPWHGRRARAAVRRWEGCSPSSPVVAERAGFGLVITPLIEHLEVFQRVGESTDIVRKEMYDFEDKGGRRIAVRPEITAGLMRAFVEHHPTVPWKVWTAGAELPLRGPAGGPLPPALPARRRDRRDGRPRCRRRGHRPPRRLPPRPRAEPAVGCSSTPWATTPSRAATLAALTRLPPEQRRRPLRAEPGDAGAQPAAGPRLRSAGGPAGGGGRAPGAGVPLARTPRRASTGCRRGSKVLGIAVRDRAPAGARARLLQPHAVRVRRPTPSTRRRTRSAAAVATTVWSRPWAVRPGRAASASARGSSGSCWPATPRACSRRPTARVQVFVVDTTGWAGGAGPRRTSCGRPASAPTGRSTSGA